MDKYGFIYLWYDRKHKRYYIGCHWGTIDDGYICSSKWMKKTYLRRPQDFKRRILKTNIPRELLLDEEHIWLKKIKPEELKTKYYNISQHHFNHWSANPEKSINLKEKLSNIAKELHKDPIYREKMLEGCRNRAPQTKETILKRAKSNTGKIRSEETKEKMKQSAKRGPAHFLYGKELPEETKEKIRQKLTGSKNPFYGKTHTDDCRKRMGGNISKALKGKTPKNLENLKKSFWWNNGVINKRSMECPGENWNRGQLR